MKENYKKNVEKYISVYESLSINNLDTLKTHLPMTLYLKTLSIK